ncbi:MAG TPA: hypothetical protein VGF23_26485 [Gaiellaceae bacterium]
MSRPETARGSNELIARKAERYRFVSRVPMLCECSDPGCDAIFLIELDHYREASHDGYLTAPGHGVESFQPERTHDTYWLHTPS